MNGFSLGIDVRGALRDFRRTWPQLLLTDLLARIAAFVVLTPVTALLLGLFLIRTDDQVLTDTDIAVFVLHPIGITALIVVGGVWLAVLFAEQAVLMVVGFGALDDRQINYLDAMRFGARRAGQLVVLAGEVIVRALLVAAPFLAAVGGVYLLLLSEHDINFYLSVKPPEFRLAVALAGLILAGLAVILLRLAARWILAGPIVLFDRKGARQALRDSARATSGAGWRIVLALVVWCLVIGSMSGLVTVVASFVGNRLVPDMSANLAPFAAGLAFTLLLWALGELAVQIVAGAFFPLLLVRLYRCLAGPGSLVPEPASRGSLGDRAALRIPGKAILWAGAAAFVVVGLGVYALARHVDPEQVTEIIAHRGASKVAPENTVAAFERAITDGADWIELDVQENAEGEVIVIHDSDFMKVAGNRVKVWDATRADLQDLDIGSWFDPEFADQRVPTLREALLRAKGRAGVVIELKYYGHAQQLEPRVVEIVEQTGMESQIQLMSLKLDGVRKTAALRPSWEYGLLNTAAIGDLTRLENIDFLALNAAAATPAQIRRAHKRGMKVYVWTVNDPVQMSVMISRGADGLITDYPDVAQRVLELREELSVIGNVLVWIAGETGLLHGVDEISSAEDA